MDMAKNAERIQGNLTVYAELAAKERKRYMRFRGVNDISKRFRDGLWPVCPHCNELIDPMEIGRFSSPKSPKEVMTDG